MAILKLTAALEGSTASLFGDKQILQAIQDGSEKWRTAKLYLPAPGRSVAGRKAMQNCCHLPASA